MRKRAGWQPAQLAPAAGTQRLCPVPVPRQAGNIVRMKWTLVSVWTTVVAALLGAPAIAPAQAPPSHQHRFTDAPKWAKSFDDPARDAWQKPQEVIAALALPHSVTRFIAATGRIK